MTSATSSPGTGSPTPLPRRVAIVGGGIAGLAAAHRLHELEPTARLALFEASGRVGGVLQTVRRDGYLIERSADMFTTREPWALALCQRLGIAGELIGTNSRFRRAFVVRRGRLLPVPEGFTLMSPAKVWPILTTPILSPLGKLRMAWEYFTPARRNGGDESLASFVVRRFGRETFDRLVQPLIGGIYTADPEQLSLAATLPQFLEYERQHGSVIRGVRAEARRKASSGRSASASGRRQSPDDSVRPSALPNNLGSGARYGMFLAPREGMGRIVEALATRLPTGCIRLNSPVESIHRDPAGNWLLTVRGTSQAEAFDDLIVAAPAHVGGSLLQGVQPQLAQLAAGIPHAGASLAILGYRRDQIVHRLDGFGLIVPAIEKRKIIAAGFPSIKFAGRAPDDRVQIRVFIGGALQPHLAELPEEELLTIAHQELRELLGIRGEPELREVARWLRAMPQYHVGHVDRVREMKALAAAVPHFALAGNAYEGVGVPFCIHSGEQAAEHIHAQGRAKVPA